MPHPPEQSLFQLDFWVRKMACWRHSTDKVAVTKDRARGLNPERFQGALRTRKLKSSGGHGCPCFQASFLNVLVKCRPRFFRLTKLGSSCLQRERYSSRCGESREMSFDIPPARGRRALKRSFPLTLLARSSVQEDTTSRRGQLLQMRRERSSPWSSQQTPSDPPTTSDRHPIDAQTKSNLLLGGSRILISCCGARCRNTSSYGCRRRGAPKLATPLSTLA